MIKGRIIKGIGGLYFVETDTSIYECSVRGIFRKNKIIPTVGDFVYISVLNGENKKASIEKIDKRFNELLRPRVANVDMAIITFASKNPAINIDVLDRFLILAEQQKLETIICINKIDLCDEKFVDNIKSIYEPMYNVIGISTINEIGIAQLKKIIDNKVSVFAGPSGVGKTSIVNSIVPDKNFKTGELSIKIERGKHTTRQVELIKISSNSYIVDSPGFTSLNLDHIKTEELQFLFKEFKPYINNCRFNDCMHLHEPECAVKSQIGINISQERYNRYFDILNEFKQRR